MQEKKCESKNKRGRGVKQRKSVLYMNTDTEIKIDIIEFPEIENKSTKIEQGESDNKYHENESLETILAQTENPQIALEWCAVLGSQKINFTLDNIDNIWYFKIEPDLYENAKKHIEAYESERGFFQKHLKELENIEVKPVKFISLMPYIIPGLLLLFFFIITGPSEKNSLFFQIGVQKPTEIFKYHQVWRSITSLTLHANLPHVLGNMIFFIVFTAVAGEFLGAGIAVFTVILSGILGNLTTAFLLYHNSYTVPYDSLGASTAVFGALGLIVVLSILKRKNNVSFKKSLPIIAGFALLSLTGTAPGSDVFAHFSGFVWGGMLAVLAYTLKNYAKNIIFQTFFFILSTFAIFIAWSYALHSLN
jgi:membrane associated rhomboid family serine protease